MKNLLKKTIDKARMSMSELKLEEVEDIEYAESADCNLDTVNPLSGAFDENSFNFSLTPAEPLHTEVLIASATFKSGENAGLPVPLNCTWFNMAGEVVG